jgi:hypothetical protein
LTSGRALPLPSALLARGTGASGNFTVSVRVHNFQRSYLLLLTPTLVEKFSKVLPTATYCDFGVNANWRRNPKADQTKSEGRFSTAKYAK